MASPPNTTADSVASPTPRRRSRLLGLAGRGVAAVRKHPLAVLATTLTITTGSILGLVLWQQAGTGADEADSNSSATLAAALAELDSGNRTAARYIASELRLRDDLPLGELGGPAYVLGVAIAQDAADRVSRQERRPLYLLASRYLEEAMQSGLPADRMGHAQYLLGKSLFEYQRFAESLPVLHQALESYPEQSTDIHRMLASAYLQDSNPQLAEALHFNQLYLTDSELGAAEREAALITQAQIQFRMDDINSSSETLGKIPETSRHYASALLLEGEILLREGDREQGRAALTPAEVRPAAKDKYTAAIDRLRLVQERGASNHEIVGKSRYLLGTAYRKLADFVAAEDQFSRTSSSHFETPAGLAAGLHAAEIQRLHLGEHEKATESYRQVLSQAADMPVFSNPWISLDELRERALQAYQQYVDAQEFEHAIELAHVFSPLFAADNATELQAEAQQALAEQLMEQAQGLPAVKARPLLERAQGAWRQAGAFFARLATQRFSTRQYPDALWHSANAYLRGHDYRRAVRLLKAYLDSTTRKDHPPALTALGKGLLALGRPQEALKPLNECIEFFAKDPHSYQARLVAAQAHLELSASQPAKDLLITNLEHESLTPSSIEWRESLYSLGKIFYREGLALETRSRIEGINREHPDQRKDALKHLERAQESFQESIKRLSEAVQRDELNQRDPFSFDGLEARYMIAEAHRKSAKLPLKRLATVSIETTQNMLNSEIQRELTAAERDYQELQDLLNQKQETTLLSPVEQSILRNCYFARADALYDLKRFEEAIQAYSNATNRYQHEPESLEAYVQIANSHRQLNRPAEARGTLEQAKVVLARIRSNADFTSTTRYDRKQWAELLDWLTTL